jgi:hypothetical protein
MNQVPSAELAAILKDIEYGSLASKVSAVERLWQAGPVPADVVVPVLRGALARTTPQERNFRGKESLLRLLIACKLAWLGDHSPEVAKVLREYLSVNFITPAEQGHEFYKFPWLVGTGVDECRASIAALEAMTAFRGNEEIGWFLLELLRGLESLEERESSDKRMSKYLLLALAALGYEEAKPAMEYYRDHDPDLRSAAEIALQGFGTQTFLQMAAALSRLTPAADGHAKQNEKSSAGCLVFVVILGVAASVAALAIQ